MSNSKFYILNFNRGFSLLELLLYIAILSVITLIFANIFLSLNKGRGKTEARSEVNSTLRFGLEKITQDLKLASAVTSPASTTTPANTLTMTISGTSVTYCVSSDRLRRQAGGACNDSSEAITSDQVLVLTPTFTRRENANSILNKTVVNIEISLSANYNSSSPDWQYSASKKTSVSLR